MKILLSSDSGETWRESTVEGSESMYAFGEERYDILYLSGWIGSFGEDGMYLALGGPLAMGSQPISLFISRDNGATWRETDDPYHQGRIQRRHDRRGLCHGRDGLRVLQIL